MVVDKTIDRIVIDSRKSSVTVNGTMHEMSDESLAMFSFTKGLVEVFTITTGAIEAYSFDIHTGILTSAPFHADGECVSGGEETSEPDIIVGCADLTSNFEIFSWDRGTGLILIDQSEVMDDYVRLTVSVEKGRANYFFQFQEDDPV